MALWIAATPVMLFVCIMVMLYIPAFQQFAQRKAASIVSEATGLDISVGRIDLRFPLNLRIRDVLVKQGDSLMVQRDSLAFQGDSLMIPIDSLPSKQLFVTDTLLYLNQLELKVQALPLFKGRVELDRVALQGVDVHTGGLIEGMRLDGTLESFALESHGIDLNQEEAVFNRVELKNTAIRVMLNDTTATEPTDSTSSPIAWRFLLHQLTLDGVDVELAMPQDSMQLAARIGRFELSEVEADLNKGRYAMKRMLLDRSGLSYGCRDILEPQPAVTDSLSVGKGLDPSHLVIRQLHAELDSVHFSPRNLAAQINAFSFVERSGFTVNSLTGKLYSDSTRIYLAPLKLTTPHSEIELQADSYWDLLNAPTTGNLSSRLKAYIGKQDVMLLAGDLPQSFQQAYPFRPLTIRMGTEGNLNRMYLSRFDIDLPGAFTLTGEGDCRQLTDSLRRQVQLKLDFQSYDLNFLTALSGQAPQPTLVIPDSLTLHSELALKGPQLTALLNLNEQEGHVGVEANYNLQSEAYKAHLSIDDLRIDHFLPKDSIYNLSAFAHLEGRGTDLSKRQTLADLQMTLRQLQYHRWDINNIQLNGAVKQAVATASLSSDNPILQMQSEAEMRLDRRYLDGHLAVKVDQLDLYKLEIAPKPLKRPFAFGLQGEASHDSVKVSLDAGDLNLRLKARSTIKELLNRGDHFMAVLIKQIDDRRLDHAALREALPSARMVLTAGKKNPVSYYLATKEVSYDNFRFSFGFSPRRGINGRTAIHGLRIDSLQLDTIFFRIAQDSSKMILQGGVENSPTNPQFVFRSTLTGEIRNEDAELTANYVDGKGETGVLFGIQAKPLTEGHGKGNGLLFHITPEEPIFAFRTFHFAGKSNWLYLHKNGRMYSNIDMESDDGLSFRLQSNPTDTISLQNVNVELNRLNLKQLSDVIPYMPRLTGLLSTEAHYIQTPTTLQFSADAYLQEFTYEKYPVGNLNFGATWLPDDEERHFINAYMSYNDEEVLTADGVIEADGEQDLMMLTSEVKDLPLKIVNAFIPNQMATFDGKIDGIINVSGYTDNPMVDGLMSLEDVSVAARQVGAKYRFDNRSVKVINNQLLFEKLSIFTTNMNPFVIDGKIDFRNVNRPMADLKLRAENYLLLDAPRTRESLVYGKALVDLNATLKGPLDGLMMRGNMNVLGSTNLTYVLTDSPLTVEDRLDGLVTFTSFRDTVNVDDKEEVTLSLGGMDMLMNLHLDESVRLRADLSMDRSKYIELEGGGDLNMRYTPQGDINLTGRYTLSGGTMKYSIPIIPLKEFTFANGSYVDWRGDPMTPTLNLKATERIRASVADNDGGQPRMVNFDVSIGIKNNLSSPDLLFDIEAPEDATIQNELESMGRDERNKQAITMLATGIYLGGGRKGGLTMSSALNSVLQSQINSLAGGLKNASISVGIEDRTSAETGDTQKDFSFRYAQRLFNDRVQIVIGGKVSTGSNATNSNESFIDNISLEYRLDRTGTRYIRAFHNKNYESILDGEITETGVGVVLRRKMDRLGELFIFKRKKKDTIPY